MFQHNLQRFRQAAGFTQLSFAQAMGVPLRTVQNWEQGHREPRLDTLVPLARVLGVTADDLLTPTDQDAAVAVPPLDKTKKKGRKLKGG